MLKKQFREVLNGETTVISNSSQVSRMSVQTITLHISY